MIENTYPSLQCSGDRHLPQRPLPSCTRKMDLETEKEKRRERQGEKYMRSHNRKLLTWFISIAARSSGKPCFTEGLARGKLLRWVLAVRQHAGNQTAQAGQLQQESLLRTLKRGLQLGGERVPAPRGCSVLAILLVEAPAWPHMDELCWYPSYIGNISSVPSLGPKDGPTWLLL